MDRASCMFLYGALFALILSCASAQTVHIVGDGLGWDIPPSSDVSYANWTSGRSFTVGDILVFNFMTNQHDVLRVPQASYDACTQDNAIGQIITTGPANITLDSAGDHHYICTVGRHCLAGQRLSIMVSSTPGGANPPMSTAPPTTPTTPSPASTQPGACAPSPYSAGGPTVSRQGPPTGVSQPDNSASTSLATTLLLVLLSIGAAMMV